MEFSLPVVATTPWMLAPKDVAAIFESDKGPRHACEGESSVMLAIAGDIVRTDKFEEAMRQRPAPVEAPAGFSRFYSFPERAPVTGTVGDPRTASAAKGESFLTIQARELANAMRNGALWSRPDPVWRAGRGQESTSSAVE